MAEKSKGCMKDMKKSKNSFFIYNLKCAILLFRSFIFLFKNIQKVNCNNLANTLVKTNNYFSCWYINGHNYDLYLAVWNANMLVDLLILHYAHTTIVAIYLFIL